MNFFFICNLCSCSRNGILINFNKYNPNNIIITPPTLENHILNWNEIPASKLLNKIPANAKITEKPKTKKTVFKNILILAFGLPDSISFAETPVKYARNAGINGSTQGDKNDTIPARNAMINPISFILNHPCKNFLFWL